MWLACIPLATLIRSFSPIIRFLFLPCQLRNKFQPFALLIVLYLSSYGYDTIIGVFCGLLLTQYPDIKSIDCTKQVLTNLQNHRWIQALRENHSNPELCKRAYSLPARATKIRVSIPQD